MGIRGFCQDLTDRSSWNCAALGANGLERIPRAVEGVMLILAAMTPHGLRCPLLCKRLTAHHVIVLCSGCRRVACPLLCLRDYGESIGGKRFEGQWLDQLSDGCALVDSLGEGMRWVLEVVAADLLVGTLRPLQRAIEWITLWSAIGEPLCGLLAHLNTECQEIDCTRMQWLCVGAGKACDTLYQSGQDTPAMCIFSGLFSMYQAYKEIPWEQGQ